VIQTSTVLITHLVLDIPVFSIAIPCSTQLELKTVCCHRLSTYSEIYSHCTVDHFASLETESARTKNLPKSSDVSWQTMTISSIVKLSVKGCLWVSGLPKNLVHIFCRKDTFYAKSVLTSFMNYQIYDFKCNFLYMD
jgi:hypothetical protein